MNSTHICRMMTWRVYLKYLTMKINVLFVYHPKSPWVAHVGKHCCDISAVSPVPSTHLLCWNLIRYLRRDQLETLETFPVCVQKQGTFCTKYDFTSTVLVRFVTNMRAWCSHLSIFSLSGSNSMHDMWHAALQKVKQEQEPPFGLLVKPSVCYY